MLPSESARQLVSLRAAISALEERLSSHVAQPKSHASSESLPLGQANWYLALCRAVSALYVCHMRLSGLSVEGHPHAKDLERLQLYRKKIEKIESEKWFSEKKRSLSVNVSAANRFISHAIPELTPQQHVALREAEPNQSRRQVKRPKTSSALQQSAKEAAESFLESLQAQHPTAGSETQSAHRSSQKKRKQYS